MSLKNKYNIDDDTWQKLWKVFKTMVIWFPSACILLVVGTWAFIGDLSWAPVIIVLWLFPYLMIISFSCVWLVRSKFTVFVTFLMMFSIVIFFATISSVGLCSFFGLPGVLIQNLILFVAGMIVSRYYYIYWDRVWGSHEGHNKTIALDLENGRYDFLNNFSMSEDKINNSNTQRYSNPALINIALTVAPIGVAIPLIFSKFGDHSIPLIIMWVLAVPCTMGFLKPVVGSFYNFKKLSYYEKKIGKPIINGLLTDNNRGEKEIDMAQVFDTLKQWDYWVDITRDDTKPIFQGKVVKVTRDLTGLGVGVLIEKNVPLEMVRQLKNSGCRIEYLASGKILGKFLIDLQSYIIIRQCEDGTLRKKIEEYLSQTDRIEVKHSISSSEIDHPDQNGQKQFDEVWARYLKE